RPLLRVDLSSLLGSANADELGGLLLRECVLLGAVVELERVDAAMTAGAGAVGALLAQFGPLVIATGAHGGASRVAAGCGYTVITVEAPDANERGVLWTRALAAEKISLDADAVALLATRYRLLPAEIAR